MDRFLEVRSSGEAHEFRRWIRSNEGLTESDIEYEMAGFANWMAKVAHSTGGKGVRVAFSTIAGLTPGVGTMVGLALSILDTFVLERVLPLTGPKLFLSKGYPSIFEKSSIDK